MSQYFPKPYEPFGGDINVKVDLSDMQQKQILKIFHMLNLANLKSEVDKLPSWHATSRDVP